jgi:uncharacterized protein YbjT (DUF2867 family)
MKTILVLGGTRQDRPPDHPAARDPRGAVSAGLPLERATLRLVRRQHLVRDGRRRRHSVPGTSSRPTGLAQAGRFIKQAAAEGLRRVVLLSGRGVGSPGREFPVYESGLELEHAVKDSGADWTIVRPAWFAQGVQRGLSP